MLGLAKIRSCNWFNFSWDGVGFISMAANRIVDIKLPLKLSSVVRITALNRNQGTKYKPVTSKLGQWCSKQHLSNPVTDPKLSSSSLHSFQSDPTQLSLSVHYSFEKNPSLEV